MCSAFLWTGAPETAKDAKVSWASVCTPKKYGGLGLRRVEVWNRILCLRLIWLLFTKGGSLWVAWVKSNLLADKSFWDLKTTSKGSWSWKKLLKLRSEARTFSRCRLGNGSSCNFWLDSWLPQGPLIAELGESGPRQYLLLIIHLLYDSSLLPFSTSRAWDLLHCFSSTDIAPWHKSVWFTGSVPKHAFISWLAVKKRLPTRDRLLSWGLNTPPDCLLCGSEIETTHHIFFGCDFSNEIWTSLLVSCPLSDCLASSLQEVLIWANRCSNDPTIRLMVKLLLQAAIYLIWRERNTRLHDTQSKPADIILKDILTTTRMRLSSFRGSNMDMNAHDSLLTIWFRHFECS
ncbi:PREDICTED: uncharacterized protein LOC109117009 [Tarenaya hassleriana]|uniref:uncharacterized protein LOC109117009 n=1 Tax=Tarenaya hassleriana TaxID=28532 RepID=UPI0008FD4F3D|nr:PREDICTED: uncharacterized protein LOC109117009 [Tarenaya hassleriana]